MITIPLIISLISLAVAVFTAIRYKNKINKCERIISQYSDKLQNSKIQFIDIYNHIRQRKNIALVNKDAHYEMAEKLISHKLRVYNLFLAYSYAREEEILHEIERFLEKKIS